MINLIAKYENTIAYLKKEFNTTFDIAIVLGSGLGDFTGKVNIIKSVPVSDIPGYPVSTVEGHKGVIHMAEFEGKKVLLFQGRVHFYEGYNLSDCLIQTHIVKQFGIKHFLLTNAAGGVNLFFQPGDLMFVNSLNSGNIQKELSAVLGVGTMEHRNRVVSFPDKEFKDIVYKSAIKAGVNLKEGNYWFGKGPSYETPAEVRMIGKYGFDAVGMSTAHEVLYAATSGIKTVVISCITNYAAGMSPEKLSHEEVTITAKKAASNFENLVKEIIKGLN